MKDKDVAGTLKPLLPSVTHLVLTRAHTDRALAPETLADAARRAGWRGPLEVEPESAARSSGRGRTRPSRAPRARSSSSARCSRDGVARDILAGFPDPLWFQHACVLTTVPVPAAHGRRVPRPAPGHAGPRAARRGRHRFRDLQAVEVRKGRYHSRQSLREARGGRGVRERRHARLRGPARILGRHTQGPVDGQRHVSRQGRADIGRPGGDQLRDASGHLLQRVGVCPRGAGSQARRARRAGARCLLLRRHDREDRRRQVPDHERRLHHLRAADAPLADHLRLGDAARRALRVPHERRDQGERRAGVLPAGALLPDPEG